jgi:hypothetical protein
LYNFLFHNNNKFQGWFEIFVGSAILKQSYEYSFARKCQ